MSSTQVPQHSVVPAVRCSNVSDHTSYAAVVGVVLIVFLVVKLLHCCIMSVVRINCLSGWVVRVLPGSVHEVEAEVGS